MKRTDFYFDLDPGHIAQTPSEKRGESRLMLLDRSSGETGHYLVTDLPFLIEPGSLMVFNNSRVRKARIFGIDEKGRQNEFLLLDMLADRLSWRVMTRHSKRLKAGMAILLPDGKNARINARDGEYFVLTFSEAIDDTWLDRYGHIPLPPYIKRNDSGEDSERYQTVYSKETGSVAAPTAGLHFTRELFDILREKGIETSFITLHVGLGTFLPVRTEDIEDHAMHRESFYIDDETALTIEKAKHQGRKIIAVGTTSARTLESAWQDGKLCRGENSTNIFIYGSYQFKLVDRLFTNFHTPESSLLMLVSAFCAQNRKADEGRTMILDAYQKAIEANYRFFSYGDAMLII
ncbi:MAG: tRNA preQ1(34) S-adenosylmethionine ribosyltransferase-isomerase QueA [Spirochaetaceae bacterium]|jgi:S-adenosylmethionine:tRNA ribosyltransferase-isomerase|nr:tRNA preQ1(34) S-adenosylmethionine ribosyltransferase-isomerase QueA [Spirochaetaceae bacterium]